MEKEDAITLIEDLGGDEHAWIDFKEDYEIGGIANAKAEFIRDISSLANTITDQDEHYIVVGVTDQGEIQGITLDRENYHGEGPRHIFSYDESDIQEIIDSNLSPSPNLEWHTFEIENRKFGVLIIEPLSAPPALTVQHINDDSRNRLLHQGLIYVRKGSGKKVAGKEELEDIIEYRISRQRDQILDGIHKAIDIGPEWLDRVGAALPEDPKVPLATTDNPEKTDIEVTQRISREPASTLDEQLNADISQWKYRGDDFIEQKPLYEYYSNSNELNFDNVSLTFLTQSAIKNNHLGIFWLTKSEDQNRPDILLETPDKLHRLYRAAKVLLLMDDKKTFNQLIAGSPYNCIGDLSDVERQFKNPIQDRIEYLLNRKEEHRLSHQSWEVEFRLGELAISDINSLIQEISKRLFEFEDMYNGWEGRDSKAKFRSALWDLEVILGKELL